MLCEKNGKPALNIPVLNNAEGKMLWDIANTSVPLQKQYMLSMIAILFSVLREAIKRGKLYDGNYDDDSSGVNQPPCPVVLIIDD